MTHPELFMSFKVNGLCFFKTKCIENHYLCQIARKFTYRHITMKIKSFALLLLSAVMMISCDQMQDILQGDSGKDDTEIQGPGDTPGQDEPTDDPVGETTPIGNVKDNGTYSLKGTVVTVGPDAYILADDTGAILVYGGNHGRTSMEVIKVKGTVSRYKGFDTNVFQVATSAVVLLDEESKYGFH